MSDKISVVPPEIRAEIIDWAKKKVPSSGLKGGVIRLTMKQYPAMFRTLRGKKYRVDVIDLCGHLHIQVNEADPSPKRRF
jgi:hypothetical protein